MKSFFSIILGIFFIVSAFSQDTGQERKITIDQSGEVHPWNHLNLNNNPYNFQFAIVGDRTGGHREGVFVDALNKLNLLQPEFIMSIGDLIEGYTLDETEILRQWKKFNEFIDSLQMPFFYLPGNHDYHNNVMAKIWEVLYGRSYYHFVYMDVLFLCLNSEEALQGSDTGSIEKTQFEYVQEVLEENRDVRWTFVFMHQPLWLFDNPGYWKDIEKLLKDRKHTVFAGHYHHYVKYTRNNSNYFILATTGGISRLRGPDFGEFDHVVWVTMTDEGPVISNLMLDGIWDENIVTEELYNMMRADLVKIIPLFVDEDIFYGDVFEIRITNDFNYPVLAQLRFEYSNDLKPEIVEYRKKIPPNSLESVKMKMNTDRPRWISTIEPINIFSKFTYLYEDNREIEVERQYRIAPVRPAACNMTIDPVRIDGKLDDWISLPHKGNSRSPLSMNVAEYQGDYDANYEFNIKYDQSYLYFAMRVWDNELIIDKDKSIWSQDAIRIYLDARPDLISANNKGDNRFEDYLYIHFTPQASRQNHVNIYQEERLPEGTRVVTRKTKEGVNIEVAVPIHYVVEKNNESWQYLRFNVAYFDYDGNSTTAAIWWRPEWGSKENYIGSGMFIRGD